MLGEGFCAVQGSIINQFMKDLPKMELGLVSLKKGQLVNKKIRHTNRNENDLQYRLVSDSPLIYFRQRSTFEVVADCYTFIRVQFGIPIDYSGPQEQEVCIFLKRKEDDQVEEIYSFKVKIEDYQQQQQQS